jgi:two-component system response regulator HydG
LFRNGELCNKRCSLRHRDGTRVPLVKNARVLRSDSGGILCAIEVQKDIKELVKNRRELRRVRGIVEGKYEFHGLVGSSPQMKRLFELIKRAAVSDAPVIIYGESGTGKELVASAIHKLGAKRRGPFIRVNCASLSESLLENELFGHVRGAYTGADRPAKGRFEAAHTGDIFLDEVGDVPLSTQVKLLRVLEEKEFERVGDYRPVRVDVRIIAATHRSLKTMVANGSFREDLFYRLNVIPIVIPPLRERPEDIPLLIGHYIREISYRTSKEVNAVDREAMELLTHYHWPGNVRELMNALEYAFVVCNGRTITACDLPDMSASAVLPDAEVESSNEKERLIEALITAKGKRAAAARILGVSRQTVWSRIKKHGIDVARVCGL